MVLYASAISPTLGLIDNVVVSRDAAIMSLMLLVGGFITLFCKADINKIADSSVFKSGMVACICVLGVAWLGTLLYLVIQEKLRSLPELLYPSIQLFWLWYFSGCDASVFTGCNCQSYPPAIVTALGITAANPDDSYMLVASFAAVSALFVLPTYPTLLGAVQMDDTGTTRIGKYVFNHAFFIPGVLAIAFSVLLGFLVVSMF